jgi:hypothetical protein
LTQHVSEKEFTQQVRDLARLCGFMEYHTYRSKHSSAGFPDLCLARGGRLIFAELKTEKGKVSPSQAEWLDALDQVPGVEAYLWRPSDWNLIVETLAGRKTR